MPQPAIVALLLLAAPAAAQHHWIEPNGGSFDDPANWSTGVTPGYWAEVTFDLAGAAPYTVSFPSPTHIADALVHQGEVEFDLGGNELQLEQSFRPLLVLDSSASSWPTLTLRGGRVLVDGPVYIAYYSLYGYAEGSGALVLDGPGTALAPLQPGGPAGVISVGNGPDYPGSLEVSGGAICSSGRVVVAHGGSLLRGDGGAITETVEVRGLLDPGTAADSTGALGFGDKLSLRPGSWTEIDLAFPGPGGSDRLSVAGDALLEGHLRVRLDPGYTPVIGDRFRFLTAGTVLGRFREVEMPPAPVGTQWALEYRTDQVSIGLSPELEVQHPAPGIAGQQNTLTVDHAMNGALVYLAWSLSLGTTTIPQYPGLFLDLGQPVTLIGSGLGTGGSVSFNSFVPLIAAGRSYSLQAVEPQSYRTSPVLVTAF